MLYPAMSCGPPGGAGDIIGVGVPWLAPPMLYGDAPAKAAVETIAVHTRFEGAYFISFLSQSDNLSLCASRAYVSSGAQKHHYRCVKRSN